MIITDLDATLLRTDKTISSYSVSIFSRCHEQGIKIAFATARPLNMTTDYSKDIPIDGLVATNGAFIYANGKIIHEYALPIETSRALLAELGACPNVLRISARKHDKRYLSTPPSNGTDVFCDFKTPLDETFSHLSFRTDDDAFAAAIIAKYPELNIYHVTGENLYDIGAVDCTKASGIRELAAFFGIQIANIVAFGDDFNDIEMLQECGISVAVANAIDEAKAAAACICDSNDEDGVAKWLEEHVL